MRVMSQSVLLRFPEARVVKGKRAAVTEALRALANELQRAEWKTPAEVKLDHVSASVVTGERIVFNICGNRYRVVLSFNFHAQIVFVKWVGTHAEYDEINVAEVAFDPRRYELD